MIPTKACPVILRSGATGPELLVFRHPLAGIQLVKGTIEPGESAAEAAVRELAEEAGISPVRYGRDLGLWESGHKQQIWSFHLLEAMLTMPDRWSHDAPDDGGHRFDFFWHPLHSPPTAEWHEVYVGAWRFIRAKLPGAMAP